MILYKAKQCQLFKAIDRQYFTPSLGKFLFQRKFPNNDDINKGLINYWAFTNNSLDSVGNANLYNGVGVSFTFDRYGSPNSALNLSNGYYQVPTGVYFNGGPFSIAAWINMRATSYSARLIDFGLGQSNNNIVFCVFLDNSRIPVLSTFFNSASNPFVTSNLILNLNEWYHLTATFDGNMGFVYIDGKLVASGALITPANIYRTSNFIGKSNWADDGYADGVFDEIRIYNRCLTVNQIFDLIQT